MWDVWENKVYLLSLIDDAILTSETASIFMVPWTNDEFNPTVNVTIVFEGAYFNKLWI